MVAARDLWTKRKFINILGRKRVKAFSLFIENLGFFSSVSVHSPLPDYPLDFTSLLFLCPQK